MNILFEHLYQEEVYNIPQPSLVIVLPESWETLREDEIMLLSKILAAVKLSLAAVKILTLPEVDWENPAHAQYCAADILLLFGSKVKSGVDPYKKVVIQNCKVVQADELSELDDTKKKNLWLVLKDLFSKG